MGLSKEAAEKARRNGRLGGRPKGGKNASTLEREEVMRQFRERVARMMPALTHAQAALAKGLTFLYVIKTDKKGNKSAPQIVTDTETIEAYLSDELVNDDHEYYFMATEKPNNSALDSLQDRAFGKATQPIGGPDGGPIQVEVTQYAPPKSK